MNFTISKLTATANSVAQSGDYQQLAKTAFIIIGYDKEFC